MGVWVSGWAAGESGSRAHGSRGGGDGASRARTRGGRGRNEGDLKSVRASRRCGEPRRPLSPLPPPRPRPGPGAGSGRAPRAGGAAQWQRPRWLRAGAVPRRPEARPGKFVACPARRGGELAAPEQSGTWGRGRGGSGAPFAAHAQLGNGSGGNAGGGGGGEGQGGLLGEFPAEALCAPPPPGGGGAGPRGGGQRRGLRARPGPLRVGFCSQRGGGGGPSSSSPPPGRTPQRRGRAGGGARAPASLGRAREGPREGPALPESRGLRYEIGAAAAAGPRRRHVAGEGEEAGDMAAAACWGRLFPVRPGAACGQRRPGEPLPLPPPRPLPIRAALGSGRARPLPLCLGRGARRARSGGGGRGAARRSRAVTSAAVVAAPPGGRADARRTAACVLAGTRAAP